MSAERAPSANAANASEATAPAKLITRKVRLAPKRSAARPAANSDTTYPACHPLCTRPACAEDMPQASCSRGRIAAYATKICEKRSRLAQMPASQRVSAVVRAVGGGATDQRADAGAREDLEHERVRYASVDELRG